MTVHQTRMARATEEEIRNLQQFFEELEQLVEEGMNTSEDASTIVFDRFPKLAGGWRRVLFGYEVLFENACDPSLDYLAWKPGLKITTSE